MYSEQLGENRQADGSSGESSILYARKTAINEAATTLRELVKEIGCIW
jgi:hypothetical protein